MIREKDLNDFLRYQSARGITEKRVYKCKWILQRIGKTLKVDIRTAKREDFERLLKDIDAMGFAKWTRRDYRIILRMFVRWQKKSEEGTYPPEVSWIRLKDVGIKNTLPRNLPTREDIDLLISKAHNLRDRALIRSLHDAGDRINEHLGLKLKDLEATPNGFRIHVGGKTGERKILLVESSSLLAEWLNHHPTKKQDDYLWLSEKRPYEKIGDNTVRKMLNRLKKETKITHDVNPHSFRHARATELAAFLTEAQMKAYFGWSQGSSMAQVYVHMSGRDVDNAILGVYDKSKVEQKKISSSPTCLRCKTANDSTASYCTKCGLPLDQQQIFDREEKLEFLIASLKDAWSDPKKREALQKLLEKKP